MYLFASMAIAVIFATGCASADSESKADNGTDKTEKTETTDTKKELLQTQMDFTADFSTYYGPIAAYQAAAADEATTEDELNTAAESAKKAADEGAAKLADYKLESNLPGEQKEAYTKSLDSLKSYFEEISKSLDASAAEPNFDAAQKHFDTFQSELEGIYKEADLNVPDMAQALS
ncbi:hypothetical protein SAMN05421503_1660 [Terribacillus aidingensis]|uniref:Lipoprotein n=2 Tax=Terribacillus aidingensis TaxID=586416 RepID=A0A285NMU6_9BACI|nr:hypothetical protein SAMN05421503_1660 [Terribacillus aidingensis]